jgi:NAD(P)H-flavin reductase
MNRVAANPMIPVLFRTRAVRKETGDVVTVELTPPTAGFPFVPGQFNMLYAFGVGEIPVSISGDPQKPEILVHTLRAVGAVSKAIATAKKGSALGVRGPFGNPWPLTQVRGKNVLIVAGGVGLAPIRPAIYHFLSHRDEYATVTLLYGARTPQDLLYANELQRWRGRFDLSLDISVDTSGRDWKGRVGVVTKLIAKATPQPANTVAFVCGPEIMMRFTLRELQTAGLRDEDIFITMERNMKCAVGFCGHCQFGPAFVCKDGPVFRYDRIRSLFPLREI